MMDFDSKYRRQALQSWSSSNEETKKEIIYEICNIYEITRNLFKKFISLIVSALRHSKSTH